MDKGETRGMELLIGKGKKEVKLEASMANRHGLIAGATGTGKTVTLQVLAERFSEIGVPVVLADIKGDVSGMAKPGSASPKLAERCQKLNFALPVFSGYPVRFWDVFGKQGHPVRTTVSDMGPLLLSRLLNLSDVQSAVLSLVFMIADDEGLLVLDMKDMRALLTHVQNNSKEYSAKYGQISTQSIAAIQRSFLVLEQQGTARLFGEPMLDILDFVQTDEKGRGVVNILASDELYQNPQLYSMFLLWLLAELFETFPEAGDTEKPKLVFFFDEAHLLFSDAPQVLVQKIEQVVRLIRSKGIGIYFITQSPTDIPESVLGQLGNRIQHALRAYTPKDQKAVKTAAQTFRMNPAFKTEDVITELGVGEALVSMLDASGVPGMVERVFIRPPCAQIGPISPEERAKFITASAVYGKYEKAIDRESAYELLERQKAQQELDGLIGKDGWAEDVAGFAAKQNGAASETRAARSSAIGSTGSRRRSSRSQEPKSFGETILESAAETLIRSAARSIGRQAGRKLARGVLGSLLGR